MDDEARTKRRLPEWLNGQTLVLATVTAAFAAMVQAGFGNLRDDLDARMDRLYVEVRADIREVRAEIGGLRTEMRAEIDALRKEVRADIRALREEFRADLRKLNEEVRGLDDRLRNVEIRLAGVEAALPLPGGGPAPPGAPPTRGEGAAGHAG